MLSADDRLSILETIARYNLAADRRDVKATIDLYAGDGFIDGDFEATAGDRFAGDLERIFEMEGTLKRHVSVNHVIEGGEGKAQVESLLIVVEGEAAPGVGASALIRDEMVKQDGRWLIARHTVKIDPSMRSAMGG